MSYRYLLVLLGILLAALGLIKGGWFFVMIWFGVNLVILGMAHWIGSHNVFGKRPDGILPFWSWLLFFPLLAYTAAVWHLFRLISREPAQNAVTSKLVIGRRLLTSEFAGGFDQFIDLTSEFVEPRVVRRSPAYRNFPILDGGAPDPAALRAAVASLKPGRIFIHCAQGHGRTALFALAVLLHSGTARDVADGLQMLTAVRPAIHLNKQQRRCIDIYAKMLGHE